MTRRLGTVAAPSVALVVALAAPLLGGCGERDAPSAGGGDAVVRLGDAALTASELARAVEGLPADLDSAAARRAVVEAWVARELLVQEARRAGLDADPEIVRRLEESARAVLEDAARDRLLADEIAGTDDDVASYYERNRETLALREPYVRLRHLRVPAARAGAAERALAGAIAAPDPDAAFAAVARRFASDPDGAVAFAESFAPESRLREIAPALADGVTDLPPGATTAVLPDGPDAHVVQIVDRVPEGAVPPLAVIEAELTEQLRTSRRRDAEARLLERLRAEAVARGDLVQP